ncbi:hypothetical protein [Lewinella cohaerens]|uniref:hypothetical protein n=1 Tax=Lewinella cohaerens TaxID=70995 RepID=UPI00036E751D|nr:hypothetical protein [Lewinella cohaerens]
MPLKTRELPAGAASRAETERREGRATASPEGSDLAAIPIIVTLHYYASYPINDNLSNKETRRGHAQKTTQAFGEVTQQQEKTP